MEKIIVYYYTYKILIQFKQLINKNFLLTYINIFFLINWKYLKTIEKNSNCKICEITYNKIFIKFNY